MRLTSRSRPARPSLGLGTKSRPPGICSGGRFCKAADRAKAHVCAPGMLRGRLWLCLQRCISPLKQILVLNHFSTKQSTLLAYISIEVTMQAKDMLSLCGLRAEHRSCGMSSGRGHPVLHTLQITAVEKFCQLFLEGALSSFEMAPF